MKKRNLRISISLLTLGLVMMSCAKEEVEVVKQKPVEKTEYRAAVSTFDEMVNSKSYLTFLNKTYDFLEKAGTEIKFEMRDSPEENFIADLEENIKKTEFKSVGEAQEAYQDLMDSYTVFREENASYLKIAEESRETIEIHYNEIGTFAGEYITSLAESSRGESFHFSFAGCVWEATVEFIENVVWAYETYHTDGWAEEEVAHAYVGFAQQMLICITGY